MRKNVTTYNSFFHCLMSNVELLHVVRYNLIEINMALDFFCIEVVLLKGTEYVILSDPPFLEWNVWFTITPFKPLDDEEWMKYPSFK